MPISQPSQLKTQRPRVWGVAPPSPGEHSPWALGGCGKGTEDAPRLQVLGFLSARQSTGPLRPERALPLGRPARPTDSRGFFLNWSSVEPCSWRDWGQSRGGAALCPGNSHAGRAAPQETPG